LDLSIAKSLGGVGALLGFVSVFPYVNTFGIVPLISLILILIGAKGLADHYNEAGIFNNALYGVVTIIVGAVVAAALAFTAFVSVFSDVGLTFSNASNWQNLISQVTETQWMDAFFSAAGYIFLTVAIFFVFAVVSAIFFRRSMVLSAGKTGVGLFGSAGMVLLIGAILTIVFFGVLLLWISLLLIAIAFFQIKPEPTNPTPTQS
jgi:uncharacterized membrane protein